MVKRNRKERQDYSEKPQGGGRRSSAGGGVRGGGQDPARRGRQGATKRPERSQGPASEPLPPPAR